MASLVTNFDLKEFELNIKSELKKLESNIKLELRGFESRILAQLLLLKWMTGLALAGIVWLMLKAFFI